VPIPNLTIVRPRGAVAVVRVVVATGMLVVAVRLPLHG